MYWNLRAFLVLLESPWWVRLNRVYFTIFRAKVWKILIFEWNILVKKFKNCVWKEKSVERSMCSHFRILKHSILKIWRRKNVFTLEPMGHATRVPMTIRRSDVFILFARGVGKFSLGSLSPYSWSRQLRLCPLSPHIRFRNMPSI